MTNPIPTLEITDAAIESGAKLLISMLRACSTPPKLQPAQMITSSIVRHILAVQPPHPAIAELERQVANLSMALQMSKELTKKAIAERDKLEKEFLSYIEEAGKAEAHFIAAARSEARREALEEAAEACQRNADDFKNINQVVVLASIQCRRAIRALAEQPAPAPRQDFDPLFEASPDGDFNGPHGPIPAPETPA